MTDILRKYKLLDKSSRKELEKFLDDLISKGSASSGQSKTKYRNKLLQVSTWSQDDINLLIQDQSLFKNWNVEEW